MAPVLFLSRPVQPSSAPHDTNVVGAARVTHAFLPLLEAGDTPVVVNVSSGLGSLAATADPNRIEFHVALLDYNSSQTALVMITSQYARACPAITFNAVDRGYTATDLNGHQGTQSVEEGTDAIVRMASIGADGPTGGFFDRTGPGCLVTRPTPPSPPGPGRTWLCSSTSTASATPDASSNALASSIPSGSRRGNTPTRQRPNK
ncbi:hypothetical protein OG883_16220 [Streptomyces sp. NBC_01142]|uniref:hypothetical protein n=1 Tax=Streptomyces sp. NBC_01142 TaxID=2975865 RepID=UPI00224CB4C2|nr:hypothetical protein [Streptomyces sp. NBC_01142]MCX4821422.1 hypothetical protein [Streptomyces sp. NBC_01142]